MHDELHQFTRNDV
jgi:hypothetical protein